MNALQVTDYAQGVQSLRLAELPVPRPKRGQVLVRIHATPINPADLMFLHGQYGIRKPLPAVPGFEASGTVVAAGDPLGRALVGRRVACTALNDEGGTYAQYMLSSPTRCLPLLPSVELDSAATMLVNPFTAWALMDIARRGGHRTVMQSAAASAVGRMIHRLGERWGITVLHIVRRPEQVTALEALGASTVLNSADKDFTERLAAAGRSMRATLGFDAVAGALAGQMMHALAPGGRLIVYGALSLRPCRVEAGDLLFRRRELSGFWLAEWMGRCSLPTRLRAGWEIQRGLGSEFRTEIRARVGLEEAVSAIGDYMADMGAGKMLLTPNR